MHYVIDGYNMLFRLMHAAENLQAKRKYIIDDLNKKISLLKWDVSVVFDGTFQIGPGSRSHYDHLEILFTATGETADEFIINELKSIPNPRLETIITSDKTLAWHARCMHAQTESIEDFIFRLNKSYKKKLNLIKKDQPSTTENLKLKLPKLIAPNPTSFPSSEKPPEWSIDDYEQIFETKFQQLVQEEKRVKAKSQESVKIKKPRKPKRKKDPFEELSLDITEPHDLEKWLKIFEERLKNEEND